MKDVEIILVKNGLIKLGIQIEDSIQVAKTDTIRDRRKESLQAVQGALELIYDLESSLARTNIKKNS